MICNVLSPFYTYFPSFINIFPTSTAVTAAIMVTSHTGTIMLLGSLEFKEFLIAITVVGIIWIDAVFIIMNIAIELLSRSFSGFTSCMLFIAFSPSGVAAFPSPSIFAIMFMDISLWILSPFFTSGNRIFISGFRILQIVSTKLLFIAICIIPFQKHSVPNNVIVSCTALSADANRELFKSSIFPLNIAYIIDIIRNIGHNLFNILPLFFFNCMFLF